MKTKLFSGPLRAVLASVAVLAVIGAVSRAKATEIYDGSLNLWGLDPGQGGITPVMIYVDQNDGNILKLSSWYGFVLDSSVVTTSDFLVGGGLGVGGNLAVGGDLAVS